MGRQFVTISRIVQNLPHVCRHLIQNTGRAAKVPTRKYESLVPICGKEYILQLTGGPCRKHISFTDIFRDDQKRERGGKGCELRIVGKIYSLARGHRHRHETSDWTGRDTNTALHNPTVGRQHTYSKRLFHTPWTSPYTVLRCTLF